MKPEITDNSEKKIKKNIYGKPQAVKAIFPPGFGDTALDEIQSILGSLWFQHKYTSKFSLLKNAIRIDNIHLFAITELLMRSQCLTDVRLIIFEGGASGISAFVKKCRDINWGFYLNKNMSVKIKVDSVASRAFHETGLREILGGIVVEYVAEIVHGEDTDETTIMYADLYKDRLTLSISLAGSALYKRGYRGTLSASAPLREDAAACCIRKSLQFAKNQNIDFAPNTVIVPFSGTGTFAFEYLLSHFHFSPALLPREYALQEMPLFREDNFNFLLKKARENCLLPSVSIADENPVLSDATHVYCIDNSANANTAFLENLQIFKSAILTRDFSLPNDLLPLNSESNEPLYPDSFFQIDITQLLSKEQMSVGNIFMPLNPPYGLRLGKTLDSIALYKNIATKINEISTIVQKEKKNLLGFILCPNEEMWSAFCKTLRCLKMETYHFTQGGIDIRVCQFYA
jgi:23S rRNA G2445 N2-methylase RlmL